MKVLHLSYSDLSGGASLGAYQLHRQLGNYINSMMIVNLKQSNDNRVIQVDSRIKRWTIKKLERLPIKVFHRRADYDVMFSPHWLKRTRLIDTVNKSDADIVHIHWINYNFLSFNEIKLIKKPIVITVRDSWWLTGGCHYPGACTKFLDSCGACPILSSNYNKDISYWGILSKKALIFSVKPHLVFLSQQHYQSIADGFIKSYFQINVISNATSIECSKQIGRNYNYCDLEEINVIFFALDINESRKGFEYACEAINGLNRDVLGRITFHVVGGGEIKCKINSRYVHHGKLNPEAIKYLLGKMDISILPSLEEAFGKTGLESVASGVPVLCFDNTGLSSIINHKETGYAANHGNQGDLIRGLNYILQMNIDDTIRKCADEVMRNFSLESVAKAYMDLYKKVIDEQ